MLLDGIDHVAILTNDTKRLCDWYGKIFGAVVEGEDGEGEHLKLTFLRVGPQTELIIFEIDGHDEAARQPATARAPRTFWRSSSATSSFMRLSMAVWSLACMALMRCTTWRRRSMRRPRTASSTGTASSIGTVSSIL